MENLATNLEVLVFALIVIITGTMSNTIITLIKEIKKYKGEPDTEY